MNASKVIFTDFNAGYIRIVLLFASLYYMPLHPRRCSGIYSISCLLDALAGYVARRYKQQTRFGAVLDMVTDRCTTACLLVFLASAWPRWSIVFQGLMALDLASHYVHMFATLIMGGVDSSHKKVDKQRSFLLHLYYTKTARIPSLSKHMYLLTEYQDGSISVLCTQRTLFHRAIPCVFLVAISTFDYVSSTIN